VTKRKPGAKPGRKPRDYNELSKKGKNTRDARQLAAQRAYDEYMKAYDELLPAAVRDDITKHMQTHLQTLPEDERQALHEKAVELLRRSKHWKILARLRAKLNLQ
jgi:hypothetical protein